MFVEMIVRVVVVEITKSVTRDCYTRVVGNKISGKEDYRKVTEAVSTER